MILIWKAIPYFVSNDTMVYQYFKIEIYNDVTLKEAMHLIMLGRISENVNALTDYTFRYLLLFS